MWKADWSNRHCGDAPSSSYRHNLATPGSGVIAALLATPVRGQHLGIGVGGPVARLHGQRAKLTATVLAAARKR